MRKTLALFLFLLFTSAAASAQDCAEADSVDRLTYSVIRQKIKEENWTRRVSTFGMRVVMKLGIDYSLKKSVKELRPNGHNHESFPSRHSSWAYGIAGTVAYNLGMYSPWFAVLPHAVANGVGMQRVMSRNHYPQDVMGGAGIGIGTDLLSWAVGNWIWGPDNKFPCWQQCRNTLVPSLSVTTGVAIPFACCFGEYRLTMALDNRLRFLMPAGNRLGIIIDASVMSAPVKSKDRRPYPLNMLTMGAGVAWHCNFADGPWGLTVMAQGGYRHYWHPKGIDSSKGSAVAHLGMQPSVMLTRSLSLGAEVGCEASKLRLGSTTHTVASLSLSFLSTVRF